MSQEKESSLTVLKFTEKTMSKELKSNMPDDEDFNGNNGEEYLSEQAKRKGFESDKDFAYDKAERMTKKLKGEKKVRKFIDIIIGAMENSGGDFYENLEYELEKVGNTYVVAFLVETSW